MHFTYASVLNSVFSILYVLNLFPPILVLSVLDETIFSHVDTYLFIAISFTLLNASFLFSLLLLIIRWSLKLFFL